MNHTALRRWTVALFTGGILFVAAMLLVLFSRATPPAPGGTSHLLPPNQWGFGSGALQTVYYANGVPSRDENYAFQKHGYYEVRYPCSKTMPCR